MRRTCYRKSSPAPRISASTDAATAVTAEEVTAAATAGLSLLQKKASLALAVRRTLIHVGHTPTFCAGHMVSGT